MENINDKEFLKIIKVILENEEFQKRKMYLHHGKTSVYDHSLKVSYLSYNLAKKLKLDYKSAAIAGLLHDFYYKPWQEIKEKRKFLEKHGFVHAKEALDNSIKYFPELMNNQIENSILRHMFPLNKVPPKYKIAWIITLADKWVSLDTIKNPSILISFFKIKKK